MAARTRAAGFAALDTDVAAETLSEVDDTTTQASILESLDADRAAEIVEEMAPDEAADVLAEMEEESSEAILDEMDIIEITRPVLIRASEPMPTSVGTLDAIHLSTALLWREQSGEPLILATHDAALGRAAEAFGFSVIGTGS